MHAQQLTHQPLQKLLGSFWVQGAVFGHREIDCSALPLLDIHGHLCSHGELGRN